MPTDTLTIGRLAASAGVSRKAIRVWVQRGLLTVCGHTSTGYQLFTPETVRFAVFIRRARALGMSLAQIQDVLVTEQHDHAAPCAGVRGLLRTRIAEIDAAVEDLLALRTALEAACAVRPGPNSDAAVCPIIEGSAPAPRHETAGNLDEQIRTIT
ncbi:DNA-binding transcriptional regulator, MerR family [Lentzea xinjiangensis]|uniref:DNA-binding transcriptional regulator, MerR family n=1 Tax=Lentzea xinjiangensis TaxID=402600 RepID=A0A1H9TUX9_9PSEU|nr:MerR family DNA-binding protein [Lentzea xinjiangensis]SES00976.1 DNA-binding transcriptional regulator, MerR family [Lentzea xinjiangensis]